MASRRLSANSSRISFFAFQDIITAVSGILTLIVLMQAVDLASDPSPTGQSSDPEGQKRLSELLSRQTRLEEEARELQEAVIATGAIRDIKLLASEVYALREEKANAEQRLTIAKADADKKTAASREMDNRLGLTDLRNQMEQAQRDTLVAEGAAKASDRRLQEISQRVREAQSNLLRAKALQGQTWLVPDKNATTLEPVLVTVSGDKVLVDRFDRPSERLTLSKANAATGFGKYMEQLRPTEQYIVFLIRPSGINQYETLSEMARSRGFSVGFDPISENVIIHYTKPTDPDGGSETINTPPPSNNPNPNQPSTTPGIQKPGSTSSTNAPTNNPQATKPAPPAPTLSKPESWWRRLLRALGIVKS